MGDAMMRDEEIATCPQAGPRPVAGEQRDRAMAEHSDIVVRRFPEDLWEALRRSFRDFERDFEEALISQGNNRFDPNDPRCWVLLLVIMVVIAIAWSVLAESLLQVWQMLGRQ